MKTFDWILLSLTVMALVLWYARLVYIYTKYPQIIIDLAWKSKQITFGVPKFCFLCGLFICYRVWG